MTTGTGPRAIRAYRTNSNHLSACWRTFSRKLTALSKRRRNEANCYWRDATEANPGTDDRHCQGRVQAQSWRTEDLVHFHEVGGRSSERPESRVVEGDPRDKSQLGCGVGQDYRPPAQQLVPNPQDYVKVWARGPAAREDSSPSGGQGDGLPDPCHGLTLSHSIGRKLAPDAMRVRSRT